MVRLVIWDAIPLIVTSSLWRCQSSTPVMVDTMTYPHMVIHMSLMFICFTVFLILINWLTKQIINLHMSRQLTYLDMCEIVAWSDHFFHVTMTQNFTKFWLWASETHVKLTQTDLLCECLTCSSPTRMSTYICLRKFIVHGRFRNKYDSGSGVPTPRSMNGMPYEWHWQIS